MVDRQVELGGQPIAWAGAVNWLRIPADAAPAAAPGGPAAGPVAADAACAWPVETFAGFFVAGPGGTPVQVTEGQDQPLALLAVLADQGGAKVALAEGLGEYAAYDLAGGGATLGRHLVWLIDEPAAYGALDRIGPDCAGPEHER